MKFTKMQGAGNDYVYINGFTEHVEDKVTFVKWISDRHFGVGSDGAIFINPSEIADFEMEMYNADGSRSEMCGNGIRCVGKYVYDHGLTDKKEITIESFGRIKYLTLYPGRDGRIESVKVNMGAPVLKGSEIPVRIDKDTVIGEPITVNGTDYLMTCVSMGNPHAVVFIDDTDNLDIESVGPVFENHELFPNRTNTEFVQVVDKSHVKMRVWERGTGETLACGTGCCATTVACILNGLTDEEVTVKVLGGEIIVKWDRENNLIYMTGPAVTTFEGEI
ncbi:MAG: diaminopimelate epimerase [Lachnospiraceae bacterium]|nr:diaminopimelate epimerase [Lachnospiraceae bacterium]